MIVITELSKYFQTSKERILEILTQRETIVEFEYKIGNPLQNCSVNPIDFYKTSKFMMFSNAQDEIERDIDTDWDDMITMLPTIVNSFLDFGCGIGSVGINLLKRQQPEISYFVEPNVYSTEFLKWRLLGKTASVLNTLSEIPKDIKFEVILCWGVFEHLDDDTACLIFEELRSKLTSNGFIFIKNFYDQHDAYLLHFSRGEKIQRLFEHHKNKIKYARHSH